jgi:hypothetical protein
MGLIKVAVSPFFRGESWVDECTGIKFEKNARGLSIYHIPDTYDFTSIKRSIRLNNLMLIEGDPSIMNEVKDIVVPEPTPVTEEPAPVVEAPVEEAEEVVSEQAAKPKRKSNKK